MRKQNIPRKVFLALNIGGASGRSVLSGILRHVNAGGLWNLQLIQDSVSLPQDLLSRIATLDPDGLIFRAPARAIVKTLLEKIKKPIVFLDYPADIPLPQRADVAYVHLDNAAIGANAFNHLAAMGQFQSFCFADAFSPTRWGLARAEGFTRAAHKAGKKVQLFQQGTRKATKTHRDFLEWLAAIPKPAAIMASCDYTAVRVIECCHEAKFAVPEQVAVIGVDDDEVLCLPCRPALSSIRPPHEELGKFAAAELDRLMRGKPARPEITIKGNGQIVARTSTQNVPPAGALVARAIAFIDAHATESIKVGDVIRHLGVSRRLADLRFRQIRNTSIKATIDAARLKAVKKRLNASTEPITRIAADLGFSSPEHLAHFFRHQTGLPMREFRNRSRSDANKSAFDS